MRALPATAVLRAGCQTIDRIHVVELADGTWVRGRAYEARFSPEGFRCVPLLASQAPRNYSWTCVSGPPAAALAGEA